MRRWRKRILLGLGVVFLLLLSGAGFLLLTQPGARFLGKVVVPRLPGSLQYVALAGRIMSHMSLDHVRFENDMVRVSIEHFELDWKPGALIHRTAVIENLEIRGLHMEVLSFAPKAKDAPSPQEKAVPGGPPRLPVGLQIDRGWIEGVRIEVPEGVEIEVTQLELAGSLDSLALQARAQVRGPKLPAILVPELRASASLTGLDLERLVVELLGGRVVVQAHASWVPQLAWEADVQVDGLQPGGLTPAPEAWPGSVSLGLVSRGAVTPAGAPQGTVGLRRLSGSLRGLPLGGEAQLDLAADRSAEIAAALTWGPLSVHASGNVGTDLDVALRLALAELEAFVPPVKGAFGLEARVTGARSSPRVDAEIRAAGVTTDHACVDSVAGSLSLGTLPAESSRVDLRLLGIKLDQMAFGSFQARANGNRRAHALTMALEGDSLDATLTVQGGFADSIWSGALESFEATVARFGTWRLHAPAHFSVGRAAASLDSLRLESEPTVVSVAGGWSKTNGWDARLRVADVDERFWRHTLPAQARLEGRVFLHADLAGNLDGRVLGEAGAEVRGGSLRLLLDDGEEERFDLRTAFLRLAARAEQAELDMGVAVDREAGGALLELEGSCAVAQGIVADSTLLTHPLRGALRGEVVDLYFLDALSPQVKRSAGRIELEFQAAGSVGAPTLGGQVRLTDAQAAIPALGLELRELQMVAAGDPRAGFQLSGGVHSGTGRLQIEGKTPPLPTDADPARLRIQGESFKIVDTPEIDAELSADLEIAVGDQSIRVLGELALPRAKVELIEVPPTAVSPSADVVFVEPREDDKPPLEPDVDVSVVLGDEVTFRGFGTYAKLEGRLRVQQEGAEFPTGSGEIRVTEGYYRAYGQNLQVEEGRLMFAGPVNNPGLDIRVSREATDGTVAGILIGGTAEAPALGLFSDPAMTDNNILSYIITGRPIEEGTGEDQARAKSAAAMIGGNVMTTYLGSKVGLDEARIESGSGTNDASLVTGKYITPKLYMSYAIGLFDQGNLMRLRYMFSPSWAVQTETGRTMGADLFYNIERGGDGEVVDRRR